MYLWFQVMGGALDVRGPLHGQPSGGPQVDNKEDLKCSIPAKAAAANGIAAGGHEQHANKVSDKKLCRRNHDFCRRSRIS